MDSQTFLLFGVPVVVIVLTFLDFKPSGPRLVAHLWARIQAPRKEREKLRKQVEALQKKTDDQATQIFELMRTTTMQGATLREYARWHEDQYTLIKLLAEFAVDTNQWLKSLESRSVPSMTRPVTDAERAELVKRINERLDFLKTQTHALPVLSCRAVGSQMRSRATTHTNYYQFSHSRAKAG